MQTFSKLNKKFKNNIFSEVPSGPTFARIRMETSAALLKVQLISQKEQLIV